jgi:hypothetical protein
LIFEASQHPFRSSVAIFQEFKTAVQNSVSPPSFKRFVEFLKQLLDQSVASKVYIGPLAFIKALNST